MEDNLKIIMIGLHGLVVWLRMRDTTCPTFTISMASNVDEIFGASNAARALWSNVESPLHGISRSVERQRQ